jgi:hypothetical protein
MGTPAQEGLLGCQKVQLRVVVVLLVSQRRWVLVLEGMVTHEGEEEKLNQRGDQPSVQRESVYVANSIHARVERKRRDRTTNRRRGWKDMMYERTTSSTNGNDES